MADRDRPGDAGLLGGEHEHVPGGVSGPVGEIRRRGLLAQRDARADLLGPGHHGHQAVGRRIGDEGMGEGDRTARIPRRHARARLHQLALAHQACADHQLGQQLV
ncbi:hypothetical protein D3C86_1741580 [compost metagenome]